MTDTILNQIYSFAMLYGRLSTLGGKNRWVEKLRNIEKMQSAFGAVSINKDLPESLDLVKRPVNLDSFLQKSELAEFTQYSRQLDLIPKQFSTGSDLTLELLETIHANLTNDQAPHHYKFRNRVRILPKYVWENNVYKTIKMEVKTRPEEILHKLTDFVEWLGTSLESTNPIMLAGICHWRIAEIHPYDDGNGRLSRIFERGILNMRGIDQSYIALEAFYLKNRERYYDLLDSTIKQDDLTPWLEFYTEGLLDCITESVKLLYRISGGTIDVQNNIYFRLTNREEEIIELIRDMEQASGAEIAKKLKVSRQNISIILKRLFDKGLLTKIGESTSSRYKLSMRS